jgi:hypothetical protein
MTSGVEHVPRHKPETWRSSAPSHAHSSLIPRAIACELASKILSRRTSSFPLRDDAFSVLVLPVFTKCHVHCRTMLSTSQVARRP